MDPTLAIYGVVALALVYGMISLGISITFGNRKRAREIQEELNRLNKEHAEAQKRKDNPKIKEIEKEFEKMPKLMYEMMFLQMKPLIITLPIFFVLISLLNVYAPAGHDDVILAMSDNGTGCDPVAGDHNYTACYKIDTSNVGVWKLAIPLINSMIIDSQMPMARDHFGTWVVTARLELRNQLIAQDSKKILVDSNSFEEADLPQEGIYTINVETDKENYSEGDEIKITAAIPESLNGDLKVTLDRGTRFVFHLPFTVPLLNINTLDSFGLFVTILLISSLVFSTVAKKMNLM